MEDALEKVEITTNGDLDEEISLDEPVCVPKTLNPTIVVMKSAQDGA